MFLLLCCLENLPLFCKRFPMLEDCKPQRREQAQQGECLQIPQAATTQNGKTMEEKILHEIEGLKSLMVLAAKSTLTISDVSLLFGISKSTIYKKTSDRTIPHYRRGKLLFFDKAELDEWAKANRVSTTAEAEQAALSYVMRNKLNKIEL